MTKGKSGTSEVDVLRVVLGALKRLTDPAQQSWVILSALSNLKLSLSGVTASTAAVAGTGGASAVGGAVGSNIATSIPGEPGSNAHARAFLRAKNPKTAMQQVACLAYYLTHYKSTSQFKASDIKQMNVDAGGRTLANVPRDVDDAYSKAKYLGLGGAGTKILTAYGEDVVNALPDQDAVKQIRSGTRRRIRKKRKTA